MTQYSSSSDLELLFLEKFQQKYKLTERDIKKAFSKFDVDKNNLLDIQEIGTVARLMLNGVSDMQIRNLVARFDVNGDGKISYEEFLQYLLGNKEHSSASKEANDVRAARRNRTGPYTSKIVATANEQPRNRRVLGNSSSSSHKDEGNEFYNRDKNNVDNEYDRKGQQQQQPKNQSRNSRVLHKEEDDEQEEFQPDNRSSRYDDENGYGDNQYTDDDQYSYQNDKDIGHKDDDSDEEYDEFPINTNNKKTTPQYQKQVIRKSSHYDDNNSDISDVESNLDLNISSREIECRCKIYLENLRIILDKKVTFMRDQGGLANHLTMSKSELLVHTGCQILKKSFQPYTGSDSGRRDRKDERLIEMGDFMRVLRTFKFPGFPPVRQEVLQYLFELCRHSIPTSQTKNLDDLPSQADPTRLNDLIYGASAHDIRYQQLPRNNPPLVTGEQSGQRVRDTVSQREEIHR